MFKEKGIYYFSAGVLISYLMIFRVLGDFHSKEIDVEEMFFTERVFGFSNVFVVTESLLFD